ncbi:MAG: mandelate racemase/muconate lactonizing enzyme family protein [Nocardioides sp.]|uniref:mandelate racemase/muconate lactonizing enzyme family protein n=1 Tax=Nocardioides sp. TaxID=35761 RepID=UPI0039E2363D
MKIERIELVPLRWHLDTPKWDAHLDIRFRDCLLVKVHTDEGVEGIGEAAAFGSAMGAVSSVIRDQLSPLVVGEDPLRIEGIWRRMYDATIHLGRSGIVMAAMSGIDIALWDIAGKVAGLPLYKMLGAVTGRLPCYASGGLYERGSSPEHVAGEVVAYAERGFTGAKVKVAGADLKDDLARVEAVRAAVGDAFDLMVDANCGYSVQEAVDFSRAAADVGLAWLEEPVRADDLDGAVEVARRSAVPIAGYESQSSRFVFRDLIVRGAVSVVQADCIWAGGVTNVRKIAGLADSWHQKFAPHVFSSAVALAANSHLLASCPNAGPLEFDGQPNPLRDEIVLNPRFPHDLGVYQLPERPGLGLELNPDGLERYRISVARG